MKAFRIEQSHQGNSRRFLSSATNTGVVDIQFLGNSTTKQAPTGLGVKTRFPP